MKGPRTAATALALVGGAAFAGIAISGDAKFGPDCNSGPDDMMSKHSFRCGTGIDLTGSGTTGGGLSFGAKAGFGTGDDKVNTETVFVSGSFGKMTISGNHAANLLAGGIADVGMDGIGLGDAAEDVLGAAAKRLRCDHTAGNVSLAPLAGTDTGAMDARTDLGC